MKLIADSGSTKTDWALVDDEGHARVVHTQGINPVHQSETDIKEILQVELRGQLRKPTDGKECLSGGTTEQMMISEVFFYGSGVRPSEEALMRRLLSESTGARTVVAKGDLLGAARALCGKEEGLACILGTGANSCLYDGKRIVMNTPPLGYILGDEGSGAVLGRNLLNALYKGLLPARLRREFEEVQGMELTDIIARVYRQPMANRFLASLSPFIHARLDETGMREMVVDSLRLFLQRNVNAYRRRDLPLSAVGSIAYYYREQLAEAARLEGYDLGRIERSPLMGLVSYHRHTSA